MPGSCESTLEAGLLSQGCHGSEAARILPNLEKTCAHSEQAGAIVACAVQEPPRSVLRAHLAWMPFTVPPLGHDFALRRLPFHPAMASYARHADPSMVLEWLPGTVAPPIPPPAIAPPTRTRHLVSPASHPACRTFYFQTSFRGPQACPPSAETSFSAANLATATVRRDRLVRVPAVPAHTGYASGNRHARPPAAVIASVRRGAD